jgi:hypothetical protein
MSSYFGVVVLWSRPEVDERRRLRVGADGRSLKYGLTNGLAARVLYSLKSPSFTTGCLSAQPCPRSRTLGPLGGSHTTASLSKVCMSVVMSMIVLPRNASPGLFLWVTPLPVTSLVATRITLPVFFGVIPCTCKHHERSSSRLIAAAVVICDGCGWSRCFRQS